MAGDIEMKTYMAKQGEVKAAWHLVDLDGKVLGRAATKIATILMGKHRPEYTPNVDTGDFVVVINASKVKLTGSKLMQRTFESYSGYPGGRHLTVTAEIMKKHPDRLVISAVKRMLPKTKLGQVMLSKLKVYAGSDHPHQAQQPQPLEL